MQLSDGTAAPVPPHRFATPAKTPRPVTPVGIIAAMLHELGQQLAAAGHVNATAMALLQRATALADGLDPYLARCTTPESTALRSLAERTRAHDWAGRHVDRPAPLEQEMLSGHVAGQTLKFLVHATRAKRVLEIGMFTGYSALAMAEALPDDGVVVACELDPDVADFARHGFHRTPSGTKIAVRVGPALQTLAQLSAAGESFDLVFIDADKVNYRNYLNYLLDSTLLAPQAAICVDNTLMQGQPYLTPPITEIGQAIADFNLMVAADPRIEQVMLPLRDGMTLIRRTGTPTGTAGSSTQPQL